MKNPKHQHQAPDAFIYSAHQASNDEVFPLLLDLYVPKGSKIADVTFGTGVFWRRVGTTDYDLHPSDLRPNGLPGGCQPGVDSRQLPYEDGSFDAIVFDPPYMHTSGTAHNGHQGFKGYYANNAVVGAHADSPKYHDAVLELYFGSGREAWRVLRRGGVFIVKCQDEVCARRQRLTHIEITNEYERIGFIVEDLFVVVRRERPGISRLVGRQSHARKNHSYFMVYRKPIRLRS